MWAERERSVIGKITTQLSVYLSNAISSQWNIRQSDLNQIWSDDAKLDTDNEFYHGGRLFSATWSSNISAVTRRMWGKRDRSGKRSGVPKIK